MRAVALWLALLPEAAVAMSLSAAACARRASPCARARPRMAASLVWFTGHADLRVHDHGGLSAAAAETGEPVVPVFVLDPAVHLSGTSSAALRRLQAALRSLSAELDERCGVPLVVRRGESAAALAELASQSGASRCHVIEDTVFDAGRAAQRAACAAMAAQGVAVQRWSGALRPQLAAGASLPATFPEYAEIADELPPEPPRAAPAPLTPLDPPLASDGVPTLAELERLALAATPAAQRAARDACAPTVAPYEPAAARWCEHAAARAALDEYLPAGRDAFADRHLGAAAAAAEPPSLHAAAAAWLVAPGVAPSAALSLREAAERAFAPPLALGVLSAREVLGAARGASGAPLRPSDAPAWGRSSEGALADVVEWREWFALLAARTLARQDAGGQAGAGAEAAGGGDAREAGRFGYWAWGGRHLTRYAHWPAGSAHDAAAGAPALLLVHGFAASAEQWERLVCALRARAGAAMPPVYALDLLGFGHTAKPGVSYTQHLWEAHVADFALEVVRGAPLVLVGNSIGGGLGAGVAANLAPVCRGLVLCNTAGVLEEPSAFVGAPSAAGTVGGRTLRGALPSRYAPPPLVGQRGLELFGVALIAGLYPAIPALLRNIYSDRPQNADAPLEFAIAQGASSPGSPNVIGCGQKLPPQRPLNEVLSAPHGFAGPVLVPQGRNDRVSGPARAQERAAVFARLREGVTVREIEGGHCPQDDSPDAVAEAIMAWLPEATAWQPAPQQTP